MREERRSCKESRKDTKTIEEDQHKRTRANQKSEERKRNGSF
jgi:hypothetical protein